MMVRSALCWCENVRFGVLLVENWLLVGDVMFAAISARAARVPCGATHWVAYQEVHS